jgi:hypothetical protein
VDDSGSGPIGDLLPLFQEAAGRGRRTLVSITVASDVEDPCAAVFASRLASDRWFCWQQPDRGFALAALGAAAEVTSRGPDRFRDAAAECFAITREAVLDEPAGLPAGAGPVWTGGFAFSDDGGGSATWSSLPPALLVLPELSLCRLEERTFLTVNAVMAPGEDPAPRLAALEARVAGLRDGASLPLLDPHPTARTEIRSVRTPGEFEATVADATARIDAGEMRKVVVAREVVVSAPAAHDPAASAPPRPRSSVPLRSFCCVDLAPGSRPSPSPGRSGAARTLPSTTTSGSSSCAATRTGASSESSPSASFGSCGRTRSGSRRHPSPR